MANTEETVAPGIYYTALNTCPLRKNLPEKVLMTSQWVQIMIQRITAAENVVEKQGYASLHESIKSTLLTYFVDFSQDGSVLVKRPVPGIENRSSRIVPLEDSYETIKLAHVSTNHGNPRVMQEWLTNNFYLVHDMCAKVYYQLCVECNTECRYDISKIVPPVEENKSEDEESDDAVLDQILPEADTSDHVCSVDILDISKKPDNGYKYLLIYKDEKTNFIQLRPLNDNKEADVAIELIKILMDFGPPECITVDDENSKLFTLILKRVEILTNTKIELAKHNTDNPIIKQVAQNIVEWMNTTNCSNWGTGCHIVQWEMNNLDDHGRTPFSRVFGFKYTGFGFLSKFSEGNDIDNSQEIEEDQLTENTNGNDNDAYLVTITEEVAEVEDPLGDVESDTIPPFVIKFESDDENN